MDTARTCRWSPWGLHFRFFRSISQKFTRSNGNGQAMSSAGWPDWLVVGYHDSLRVTKFEDLANLDPSEIAVPDTQTCFAQGTHTDLVLLPFDGSYDTEDLTKKLCSPTSGSPLLVICQISVSPIVREFEGERSRLLESLRVFTGLIESDLPDSVQKVQKAFFTSLSGPDLVLLALPQDASQLWASQYLVRKIRHLTLAAVEQRKLRDFNEGRVAQWDGHATSSVTPVLAFQANDQALNTYNSDEFQSQEEEAGISYLLQLKVDSGHEPVVLEDIQKACNGEVSFFPYGNEECERTNWHSHSIEGCFHHLSNLVDVLCGCVFSTKGTNWREQNLVDSFTIVSCKDRHPHDNTPDYCRHQGWIVTEKIRRQLAAIGNVLDTFGKKFLSEPQRKELLSIFQMFRSCFHRHGFVSAARDLLPFFRQFAAALSLYDEWEQFLDRPRPKSEAETEEAMWIYEDFSQQIDHCLSHLSRAVRNRIEHRSVQGDPPVPHTLPHGGCKLISAYTISAYLSTEILLRPAAHAEEYSRFAAAVCAGWNGRVVCLELFRDFRLHLERIHEMKLSSIGRTTTEELAGWTARLLLLDISGRTLLRPSRCFVHSLHEVAEISEWIETERSQPLCGDLNYWILLEIITAFNDELVSAFLGDEPCGKQKRKQFRQNELPFSSYYVGKCLAIYLNLNDISEIQQKTKLSLCHPEVFADKVRDAIRRASENKKEIQDFLRAKKCPSTEVGEYCQSVALSSKFTHAVDEVREFATEVVGDVGMWFALQQLLYGDSTAPDRDARLNDVAQVYRSLLVAVSESCGKDRNRSRLEQSIFHRWAIQAAANSIGDASWKDSILAHVSEELLSGAKITSRNKAAKYLDKSESNSMQFRDPEGLVGALEKYAAYGGTKSNPVLGALTNNWESAIISSFKFAWQSLEAGREIDFVMNLWEASEHFGIDHVLEAKPTLSMGKWERNPQHAT